MPFHFLCKFHANWYAETCFCANLTVWKCTKIASQCVPYAVPLPVQVSRKLVRGNLLLCEPDCREVYENSFSMRPICRSTSCASFTQIGTRKLAVPIWQRFSLKLPHNLPSQH